MPLDQSTLAQALKTAFSQAKANSWSSDQVADAMAAAIDTFVIGADVVGVTVNVVSPTNQPLGTGSQTGTGKLQ